MITKDPYTIHQILCLCKGSVRGLGNSFALCLPLTQERLLALEGTNTYGIRVYVSDEMLEGIMDCLVS